MQDGIDYVMRVAPSAYGGTVKARLQQAKLIDETGDKDKAADLLRETQEALLRLQDQKGFLAQFVVHERVWFYLSHGDPKTAVQLLEQPELTKQIGKPVNALALDYAWALLLGERVDEGVRQMHLASYVPARPRNAVQRILGLQPPRPQLIRALDMAYALVQAGRLTEASSLPNKGSCQAVARQQPDATWGRLQSDLLKRTATLVCPLEKPKPSSPRS